MQYLGRVSQTHPERPRDQETQESPVDYTAKDGKEKNQRSTKASSRLDAKRRRNLQADLSEHWYPRGHLQEHYGCFPSQEHRNSLQVTWKATPPHPRRR